MTAPLALRPGRPGDEACLAGFNAAMALETEGLVLDPERALAGARHLLEDPAAGFYLVAEAGGVPVGSLMVTTEWSDWRNGLFWWIQSVYVLPAFRRRGVYRALHAEVERLASRSGQVVGLRLYVERDNEVARSVYAALGMREAPYRIYEAPVPPPA